MKLFRLTPIEANSWGKLILSFSIRATQTDLLKPCSVVSASLMVLLKELESACEPAFSAILKTPWMNLENVSGRSAYVVDLVASVKSVAEVVRERIELKKYIRSFADKAVGYVGER